MNSSLRKIHNDVNAYGTGKSIYYRRLSFAGILLWLMAYLSSIALPIQRWYTSWQPSRSRCSQLSLWKESLLLWCHKSFCRSIILGQALCKERSKTLLVQSMPVRRSVSSPHNKGRQFASTKTWQTTWWLSSPRCSPCMPCFVIQVWRQTRLQPISNRYSKHIHPIRWQRYCKQYGR